MKKSISKSISIILAVMLLLTALPLTVFAEGVTVYSVGTLTELNEAAAEINGAQQDGNYKIELTADIEGSININNENAAVTVTIVGGGHTLKNASQAVCVSKGDTVNLGDGNSELTIQGINQDPDSESVTEDPGLVYVMENSTCNMSDKVTIKDRKTNNYFGGGVTVQGGTFKMNGGLITNCGIQGGSVCYGGGVAVYAGGTFIMDNGTITKCYLKSNYADDYDPNRCVTAAGAGVFVTDCSDFVMNGGTISDNTVENTEGMAFGGGVAMMTSDSYSDTSELKKYGFGKPQSTVTINGGTITGNEAQCGAGVFASGYFYSCSGAFSHEPPEGDIGTAPGLFINGGEISANEADDAGGGVFVAMLKPEAAKSQIHNAVIKNNTADNGAGIENFGYWTQMDIDGCTITGNTAVTNGGGIMLSTNTSGGFTTLKNTTVTGNTSGDRGAGVYYDASSKLNISGADIIQDNTYNGKLNNLNVLSLEKPVYVTGALTGSQIGLSDPTLWDDDLEDTAPDAVSTEYLTNGYKTYNPEVHPSEYFTSDHETWIVDRSAKTTTTTTDPSSKTRRQYPVKRYPIKEDTYPYFYAGHESQYVITKIQNPSVTDVSTTDAIISELRYRFPESKYTFSSGGNPSAGYMVYKYYPIFSDSPLSSVSIEKRPNLNYVTITYYPKKDNSLPPNPPTSTTRSYGGSVVYTADPSDQSKYANSGELVLKISSKGDSNLNNSTYFNFSEQSTDETINYVDADPPGNVLYEYNEYGDVTAKYVIEKADAYTPVQATITVESGTDDEVRLVRVKPNYHINNADIAAASYNNNDIFTPYVEEAIGKPVKVGETIGSFYAVPEVAATEDNSCPYIFKGWYYDQDNDDDSHPVQFGTDIYTKDIYAHWIKVENVQKDEADENGLPVGANGYGGFDLAGLQIRDTGFDSNYGYEWKPGGMRFVTSLSTDVVDEVNAITNSNNNIEYGYVAATHEDWIKYHRDTTHNKLQYVSTNSNGTDTKTYNENKPGDFFGFAKNVNCTSRVANPKGVVREDHRNYDGYLLYTLVITYENGDDPTQMYDKNVLARPYIKYTDANGLVRVAYSEYLGNSNTIGGCYTNYNYVTSLAANN